MDTQTVELYYEYDFTPYDTVDIERLVTEYTYDAAGRTSSVEYTFEDKSYTNSVVYDYRDRINSFTTSGVLTKVNSYDNFNRLRNVLVKKPSGALVAEYQYDAWGKILNVINYNGSDIGSVNPFRYRSYYFDQETGLYYVSSRYYDPATGRFINADNQISGVVGEFLGYNMFAYCMNNPANMSDPTGGWPKWIKSAANWAKKNIIQPVKNFFSPFTSAVAATANNLPPIGEPGSSQTLPNPNGTPKQKRWYGPDGNPVRDRDYNHSGKDIPFPHDHEWKDGQRQKDHLPPSPNYEFSLDPVLGVGLVIICVIGIVVVAADDSIGIGVADDFLFGPLGAGVGEGLILIFG